MAVDKEQKIDLGLTKVDMGRTDRAELKLVTGKYNGGLDSDAHVDWAHEDGGYQHAFDLARRGTGDFRVTVFRTPKAVATQSRIDKQHAGVFTPEKIAELTEQAKAYYAVRVAEGKITNEVRSETQSPLP